jgi:putative oxidoreductase
MNNPTKDLLSLAGRVMIATIFLLSAVGNKIPNFSSVAGYMASEGVPMPQVALAGAIAFLIAGSLSVILGYKVEIGAVCCSCSSCSPPISSTTFGRSRVRNVKCKRSSS